MKLEEFDPNKAAPTAEFKQRLSMRMRLHYGVVKLYAPLERMLKVSLPAPMYYILPLLVLLIVPGLVFGQDIYSYSRVLYLRNNQQAQTLYQHAIASRNAKMSALALGAENANAQRDMAFPIDSGYGQNSKSFTHSSVNIIAGPKAASCSIYYQYNPEQIPSYQSESFSFLAEDSGYYSKSTTTTSDGTILEYWLNTPIQAIEYKGGSYAIKHETVNDLMMRSEELKATEGESGAGASGAGTSSMPTDGNTSDAVPSDTVSSQPVEPTYTGPQPELITIEKINDAEYYVYQVEYDVYCDDKTQGKGVQHQWINPKTQELYMEKIFLGDSTPTNLLSQTTYVNESRDATLADVNATFDFTYTTDIRTENAVDQAESLKSYLSSHEVRSLAPTGAEWSLISIYSQAADNETYFKSHLFDRAFYANSDIGEYQYQRMLADMQGFQEKSTFTPIVELTYNHQDQLSTVVSVLPSGTVKDQLIRNMLGTDVPPSYQDSITVDGATQSVEVFTYTYESKPIPLDAPDMMPTQQSTTLLYFERGGFTYLIRFENYGATSQSWQERLAAWKELNLSSPEVLNSVLMQVQQNISTPGSEPTLLER